LFVTSVAGAGGALLLPVTSGTQAAGATLLTVGALALLAGHAWGLFVSIPAHLTLLGRLWPQLALAQAPGGTLRAAATALVLVTALPMLALAAMVLPQLVRHLAPTASRAGRAVLVAVLAATLAAALILPALL
jgi:hypothetical protein